MIRESAPPSAATIATAPGALPLPGLPETDHVVARTRRNAKLRNRVDATGLVVHDTRYAAVVARDDLMFPGLADLVEASAEGRCDDCRHRPSYGAEATGRFGGVELCGTCRGST